ncbi:3-phosphoshikimate 1-carboxyvinyltransferase, partial [bacterium]|nr:3-phosphoshikimate 1-carboxyvinyltransferase [bacterium]
ILCVIATQLKGKSTIKGAGELRVKESDRILAIMQNIRKMGGKIEINKKDDITINGPTRLRGAKIETYGDHRICMAFSIAGMIVDDETIIDYSECVDYSFPSFFEIVDSLS